LKKRCIAVSATPSWHIAQLYSSYKNLFLLLRMSLVFKWLLKRSHIKNLILGMYFDFHNQRTEASCEREAK
jgi:hypothetical protein